MSTDLVPMNGTRNQLQPTAMADAVVARHAKEVEAAMIVAKRFPRDETASFNRIMQACKRKGLAEHAVYAFPKGGQQVTGPSIRLAEVLAQAWGNIDFGIIELDQRPGASDVMAFAWDLETNTRQTKVFTVKHERHTKQGSRALDDPRDIYETVANNGARRLRACILGIIPKDVADAALEECEKTLKGSNTEPIKDRIRNMVARFSEQGISQEMIEKRIGHKVDACIEQELASLRKIFVSIKDGFSKREDWFEMPPASTSADKAKELLQGGQAGANGSGKAQPGRLTKATTEKINQEVARLELSESDVRGLLAEFEVDGVAKLTEEAGQKFLATLQAMESRQAGDEDGDTDTLRDDTYPGREPGGLSGRGPDRQAQPGRC